MLEEEEEINKRSVERLVQILGRLNELKQQGEGGDIEEKIAEVRETLQEYLTKQQQEMLSRK